MASFGPALKVYVGHAKGRLAIGDLAVVIAVTLVFGLIAIYLLEWLSQVRRGSEAPEA